MTPEQPPHWKASVQHRQWLHHRCVIYTLQGDPKPQDLQMKQNSIHRKEGCKREHLESHAESNDSPFLYEETSIDPVVRVSCKQP